MRRFIINVLSHPFSRSPFALNLGHIATAMLPRFMSKSDSRKRALDSHLFLNNLLVFYGQSHNFQDMETSAVYHEIL